jgi:uncharacterized protein YprB with RNaseH-like and TPR domain
MNNQENRSKLPGQKIKTAGGNAYLIRSKFESGHQHGRTALSDLLTFNTKFAAEVGRSPALEAAPINKWTFLDIETTGLAGGAGTLAILVGVGTFKRNKFHVHQYFLRDPAEESGMLHALQDDLERATGIVSFNGRIFDLPILEMRYMLGMRKRWALTQMPQFDLLFPARRLWQRELNNCRLGTLEKHILGMSRTEEDVPGEEIPGLYQNYLRTGDASEMNRVIYHNAQDILSLVSLAIHILDRHQTDDLAQLSSSEALAIARWHQEAGRHRPTKDSFKIAISEAPRKELRIEALRRYSEYLKRDGRRESASELWREWHQSAPNDLTPSIELAKYYEWHEVDLKQARRWSEKALKLLMKRPPGWRKERDLKEVNHRLQRIDRKLSKEKAVRPRIINQQR